MKKIIFLIISLFVFASCSDETTEQKAKFPVKRSAVKKNIIEEKQVPTETNISTEPLSKQGNIKSIKISVVCDWKKTRKIFWDKDQFPDIFGFVEFQSGDAIAFPLKENSYKNEAYGENIILNKGDTVRVVLRDKDVTSAENIASGEFIYDGRRYFKKRIGKATFVFTIKKKNK